MAMTDEQARKQGFIPLGEVLTDLVGVIGASKGRLPKKLESLLLSATWHLERLKHLEANE